MKSCIFRNPSVWTLRVCNGLGVVTGLFVVPFGAYKATQYFSPPTIKMVNKGIDKTGATLDKLNENINWNDPKIKTVTTGLNKSLDIGVEKLGNCLTSIGIFFSESPYRSGGLQIAVGGLITGGSIVVNAGYFQLKKREFKTNELIQKVCCNRIRFFMFASLGHGFLTGIMIPGLFFIFSGGLTIFNGIKESKSKENY